MKNKIFAFLNQHCSGKPKEVDRLIISAFILINKLKVKNNLFLKEYIIDENEKSEYKKLNDFVALIEAEKEAFEFEYLIQLFEFVISPSDRIVTGAVYTPVYIRKYIIGKTLHSKKKQLTRIKVADIACGCGGFLFDTAIEIKKLTQIQYSEIFQKHIFGIDIQGYSINRTKLLLCLLALTNGEDKKEFKFNLYVGDSLDFKWHEKLKNFSGFDVVVGNPPYVCARNLDENTKLKLNNFEVCKAGNPDLYIPFFQIGIENLAKNGTLGFITMNSFFKSLNGRALRKYFKENRLGLRIIDFGAEQVFKSKNTYTCICFIENIETESISYVATESANLANVNSFSQVNYNVLDSVKGWNLKDNNIISKIETTGVSLGSLFKTRHGIATLRNDIYIFKPIKEDRNYYYLQNGSVYQIEKGVCRDIVNSNKLSRAVEIDNLIEKVIFPYTNEVKPKLLDENVIKSKFPMAFKYLKAKKKLLKTRDKGKGEYERWYAFGRTQSLEKMRNKLFFPKYSDQTPCYLLNSNDNLLFYNGLALIGNNQNELLIIKKILESSVFWYYIKTTSKPYSSNYYSLNGNYIKNFGVCSLNTQEQEYVLNEVDQNKLDEFFENKYDIRGYVSEADGF